jgi:hypothetical protein
MKKITLFIFSFIFFLTTLQQTAAELRGEIVVFPEYPQAYEPVTVTLKSYSFDVDLALISWKIDGRAFSSGYGLKSIKIAAKGTGDITQIEASVLLPNNDSLVVVYNLSPQTVDLVWEAVESYVPPFYEGKALPGEGSLIRIIALPSFVEGGRLVNPNLVAYAWKMNDDNLASFSGTGKQTLTTRLDYLTEENVIEVTARTAGGSIARSRITIIPSPILPIFYKYDEVLGINRAQAITKRLEMTKEVSLSVEPYYISKISGANSGDTYSWSLDGLPIQTTLPNKIVLRPKENSYGIKKLIVSIENTKRRLQQTSTALELVFDSR